MNVVSGEFKSQLLFEMTGGECGRYQRFLAVLVCICLVLYPVDASMAVFLFNDIPHRCATPEETSVPVSSRSPSEVISSTVLSNLSNMTSTSLHPLQRYEFSLSCDEKNGLEKCEDAGGKIEYDCCYPFENTAASEFDMICEKKHYKSFAQSQLGIGFLCASVIFGQLSDKFGRRRIAMINIFLKSIVLLLLSLCTSYYQFLVLFFLSSFLGYGAFLCMFILMSESFGSSKRFLISVKFELSGFVCEMVICGLFYVGHSWRVVPFVASASTMVAFVITLCFIHESPLWLLSQRKYADAEIVIQKMSRMNNRKLLTPEQIDEIKEFYCGGDPKSCEKTTERRRSQDSDQIRMRNFDKNEQETDEALVQTSVDEESEKIGHSAIDLFRHPVVRVKSLMVMLNWFIVTSAFYAVYLNLTSLRGSDPFIGFSLGCIIALPGLILFSLGIQWLGRRLIFCIFMFIGALCGLCILLVTFYAKLLGLEQNPDEQNEIVLVLSLIARLFFGCSFGVIYVWSSELYPTPVRNIGMGMSSMCGRIGLLCVPFALESGIIAQALVSMLGFVAAFQSFFLPETLNSPLLQTLKDSQAVKLRSLKEVCGCTSDPKPTAYKVSKLDDQKLKLLGSSDEDEEEEVFGGGEIRLQELEKLENSDSEETVFVIASQNDDAAEHRT